jgi:two-component system, chemotaxis family, sensor kinase CheA
VSVDLSEFVSGFLAEAADHLRLINANLLLADAAARQRTTNPRAVRELFRSLHTMKGLAGMVGVEPIVDIAHAMERILRDAEQHGGRLSAQAIERLLQGNAAIAQSVNLLGMGKKPPEAAAELLELLDSVDAFGGVAPVSTRVLKLDAAVLSKLNSSEVEQLTGVSEPRRALRLIFRPSPELAASGITITAVREGLSRVAELVKVIPVTATEDGALYFLLLIVSEAPVEEIAVAAQCRIEDVSTIATEAVSPPSLAGDSAIVPIEPDGDDANSANMLRVDVRRVDAAMDGLGELLITRLRLTRAVAALRQRGVEVRELAEVAEDAERKLRDVRALVLGLRMISLSDLLDRLPILVRGLQTTTGKTARIRLDVGRFEVDKGVGERLWPVLVHLVRNAIDHGLESEAERVRLGKPNPGTIQVSCRRSHDSRLEITIEDDGSGVDAKRVAERAGRPLPANDEELLDLIARPGLSTRDTATATSGRGMGIEIVRRSVVNELGGALTLKSTPGVGTRFTLEVPVTVAVVDAFRLESAQQYFLVPVASVEEFVDVDESEVVRGPVVGRAVTNAAMLSKRGKTMPLIELSSLVGGDRSSAPSKKAVIVRRNEQWFAFGVDRLLGHHEVIVRRISDPLVDVSGVSGAADLGDGQPTLLLDLLAFTRSYGAAEHAA